MNSEPPAELGNPFPGLRPFRDDEEHLFFGRESQVDMMIDKLARTRFLAVVGTSGSGKSSLVNCGLRPALHRGLMAKAGTSWRMAQFRPGSDPLRSLARALASDGVLFSRFESAGLSLEDIIDASLRMSKGGLADVYEQAQPGEGVNLLVVVDQFEELFRYRTLEAAAEGGAKDRTQEATAFVNLLLEANTQTNLPIYIVITMRSDFLGDCAEFTGLPEAINQGQYLVPRLTREERREAIAGPVGVGGGEISPVLLTRLVNDVGDNPDQLSILQHALNRTWARWQHEGRGKGLLELPHYEAIGTMARALDQHAEKAYSELETESQKKLCEKIFKALTDRGTDARGIRRPTRLSTLCALAAATPAEVIEVIDAFRKPSRSFLMPPSQEALGPDTVIDISHESLMRVWERLKGWADEEAQSAQLYHRLSETTRLHATGKAGLWRDPELQLALEWRKRENPTESWAGLYGGGFEPAMSFLAESEAQRQKEMVEKEERQRLQLEQAQALALAEEQARVARRLRRLVAVLVFVFLLAAGLAVVARKQQLLAESAKGEADRQRIEADKQRNLAETQTIIAETQTKLATAKAALAKRLELEAEEESKKDNKRGSEAVSLRLAERATDSIGVDPELAVLLAREAAQATSLNKVLIPDAEDALHRAVQAARSPKILEIPSGTPHGVAFSASGKVLVTMSVKSPKGAGGVPALWDIDSGKSAAPLVDPGTGASFAFSPNGKYLATWISDGQGTQLGKAGSKPVRLWDVSTGSELSPPLEHPGGVRDVAFSPEGSYLATAQGTYARLWAVPSGRLVWEKGHDGSVVTAVACTTDGKLASISQTPPSPTASGSGTSTVTMWDGNGIPLNPFKPGDTVSAISFSQDGRRLATVSSNGAARILDAVSGRPLRLSGLPNNIRKAVFSPDGKLLATADSDSRVRVRNAVTGSELFTLSGQPSNIISITFSPDGKHLVATSADRKARIWSVLLGNELMDLAAQGSTIYRVAFNANGSRLATASWDKTAKVWDAAKGTELLTLSGHAKEVMGVAFSRMRIATCSADRTAKVWDANSGKELFTLTGHKDQVMAVAFSPDGKRLATASWDRTAKVWDANLGKELLTLEGHADHLEDVVFSPDGKWLATASSDRTAKVWDAHTGKERLTLSGHKSWVVGVAFSPDGKRLATASADRTAKVWDVASGKEIVTLSGHKGSVRSVAFSPNGKRLATASDDKTAKVWDTASGVELFTLSGHIDSVLGIDFSPDGSRLATTGADGRTLVYAWSGEELLTLAKTRARAAPLTSRECTKYKVDSMPCQVAVAVDKGEVLARAGDVQGAVKNFMRAKELDHNLSFDPETAANKLAAEFWVEKGRELARGGDLDGATADLRQAQKLDPSLKGTWETEVNLLAAAFLVEKGHQQAKDGSVDDAVKTLKRAKQLDHSLTFDPDTEAKRFAASSLVAKGNTLARAGDVGGAVAYFRKARELDPSLKRDPDTEAKLLAAGGLVAKGNALARAGDVGGAVATFRKARELDPSLKLDPETEANRPAAAALLGNGRVLVEQNKIKEAKESYLGAVSMYARFQRLDPDGRIRANAWNDLCWFGSLGGHAVEVMEACESTVKLTDQLEPERWNFRDSRGVARALSGNVAGAIDDFQFYIGHGDNEDIKRQRQKWVEALRKGQNPFTPDVIKELFNQ